MRRQCLQQKQTSEKLQLRRNISSLNVVRRNGPNVGYVIELERATDGFFVERRVLQSARDAGKRFRAAHSDRRLIEKCTRHGRHKITRCSKRNLIERPAATVKQRLRIASRRYKPWLMECCVCSCASKRFRKVQSSLSLWERVGGEGLATKPIDTSFSLIIGAGP